MREYKASIKAKCSSLKIVLVSHFGFFLILKYNWGLRLIVLIVDHTTVERKGTHVRKRLESVCVWERERERERERGTYHTVKKGKNMKDKWMFLRSSHHRFRPQVPEIHRSSRHPCYGDPSLQQAPKFPKSIIAAGTHVTEIYHCSWCQSSKIHHSSWHQCYRDSS